MGAGHLKVADEHLMCVLTACGPGVELVEYGAAPLEADAMVE